jgi:RNA polymerase sigma factor (sigma-70 family)
MARPDQRVEFVTTHWSVVMRASHSESPEAGAALAQLCRTYWYPLYAFVRRGGYDVEDAKDLTQEFFARLIEKRDLSRVGREKGRFRSFLLAAMKHFLVSEWRRATAKKRGGDFEFIALDEVAAEHRYQLEPFHNDTAERLYERRWALTLLEKVLSRLRNELEAEGKGEQFHVLKPLLSGDDVAPYVEIGARLGLKEGAVKVAVHRLRQRYLALLTEEISQTVANSAEVEDELRHLLSVIGR